MTAKFKGIKLSFSKDGKCTKVLAGEPDMPHRTEIIQKKLFAQDFDGIEPMFFNFNQADCINESTFAQVRFENILINQFLIARDKKGIPDAIA